MVVVAMREVNLSKIIKQNPNLIRSGGLELVSGLENTLKSAERGVSQIGFVRPLGDFR